MAMRLLRLISAMCAVFAVALQAASAADSQSSATRFAATLRGSVVRQWSYTSSSTINGCKTRAKAAGTRKMTLRSSDVSLVAGSWSGSTSRARFSGKIVLGGAVQQSGTKTTTVTAGIGCEVGTHKQTCLRVNRSVSGKTTGLISRRLHRLGLVRIPNLVSSDFNTACPGEPANVRSIGGGLELAGARYNEADLFARSTGGVTLQGSVDVSTKLLNGSGSVAEHIRWTLTLRRVGV
jgi:opacity protein-like surface antigen